MVHWLSPPIREGFLQNWYLNIRRDCCPRSTSVKPRSESQGFLCGSAAIVNTGWILVLVLFGGHTAIGKSLGQKNAAPTSVGYISAICVPWDLTIEQNVNITSNTIILTLCLDWERQSWYIYGKYDERLYGCCHVWLTFFTFTVHCNFVAASHKSFTSLPPLFYIQNDTNNSPNVWRIIRMNT